MAQALGMLLALLSSTDNGLSTVTAEEAIARWAAAQRASYVLTPAARRVAADQVFHVAGMAAAPDRWPEVLRLATGMTGWTRDRVTVWFAPGEAPALIGAAMRHQLSRGPNEDSGGRVGALDLDGATASEALAALANAFDLAVVVPDMAVVSAAASARMQVDGLDAERAVAILGDILGLGLELHGTVVLVTNPGGEDSPEASATGAALNEHEPHLPGAGRALDRDALRQLMDTVSGN